MTVDKPTLDTELLTSNLVTVTLKSSGGFSGTVTLAGAVVDSANAPLTEWTVAFDNASVTVPANGTATAVATLKVPSDSHAAAGTLNITATSSLGTSTPVASAVTVAPKLTFTAVYANPNDPNSTCMYPPASTTNVRVGTEIHWLNKTNAAAAKTFIVHIEVNANSPAGLAHENNVGTPYNQEYVQTVSPTATIGSQTFWYCHSPGPTVTNQIIKVVQ